MSTVSEWMAQPRVAISESLSRADEITARAEAAAALQAGFAAIALTLPFLLAAGHRFAILLLGTCSTATLGLARRRRGFRASPMPRSGMMRTRMRVGPQLDL